jgi:hypothetical protein
MFQYAADLGMIFSPSPLHVKVIRKQRKKDKSDSIPDDQRNVRIRKQPYPLNTPIAPIVESSMNKPDSFGRQVLLDNMDDLFETREEEKRSLEQHNDQEPKVLSAQQIQIERQKLELAELEGNVFQNSILQPQQGQPRTSRTSTPKSFGSVHLSEGLLDLHDGVAYSLFIEDSGVERDHARRENDHTRREKGDTHGHGMEEDEKDEEEETINQRLTMHHREWFASSVDGVVVGKLSCSNLNGDIDRFKLDGNFSSSSNFSTQSCLNVAMKLSRDSGMDGKIMPPTSIKVEKVEQVEQKRGLAFGRYFDEGEDKGTESTPGGGVRGAEDPISSRTDKFAMQMTLMSGNGLTLPHVVMCGVIICTFDNVSSTRYDSGENDTEQRPGKGSGDMKGMDDVGGRIVYVDNTGSGGSLQSSLESKEGGGSIPAVVCNSASSLETLIKIVESSDLESTENEPQKFIEEKLLDQCWNAVSTAHKLGVPLLKERHVQQFNEVCK